MSRKEYLNQFTVSKLRIYGRRNGMIVLQKWNKPELVDAIVKAGL